MSKMWFGLQQDKTSLSLVETNSIFYVDSDYESLSQQTSTKVVMFMRSMYEQEAAPTAAKRPSRFVYLQRNQLLPPPILSRTSRQNDVDAVAASINMESEVRSLRQEVARTQESLRAATRRCRELVRELDALSAEHDRERLLRDQQLSRILRALLVLESRLRHEQKSIRQLLCEKDTVIRNQQLDIARLRRYTKNYIKGQNDVGLLKENGPTSLESNDFQEDSTESSGLSKDIQKLKHEIITKLNESIMDEESNCNIRKTHSFAGSDISKASLTSSENTDASIITTTTDGAGSPSLLSTEGFCEGESTDDLSPGSTLNKSNRCTPSTDSETEVTMKPTCIERSESKDDGMDCNYVSDEDESLYGDQDRLKTAGEQDTTNNNSVQVTLTRLDPDEQNNDESSGNWYSDPDEDRINDELLRHSVYRPNPSKHNSVLECVNQILLRDMEEEENNRVMSMPRRFKHRGKIVRFQPARLSDIESVGSEMERRNSEEPAMPRATTPTTITTTVEDAKDNFNDDDDDVDDVDERQEDNDGVEPPIEGFEATNSEDEFGMRIVPALDPESGLEEDVDDMKARPIVIIEPCTNVDQPHNLKKSLTKTNVANQSMERIDEKICLSKSSSKGVDTIAKNLDYEEIESLPEILSTPPKKPPALPPKPQFRNSSTLILKKIPSPSFLIDETKSHKKLNNDSTKVSTSAAFVVGMGAKNPIRSLNFGETTKKNNNNVINNLNNNVDESSYWKNRFNNVRSSFQLIQQPTSPEPRPKVTNIVKHFEEFKIEDTQKKPPSTSPPAPPAVDEYDIQQNFEENFEEFNLDECDLSSDESPEVVTPTENPNNNAATTGNYDNFLEATGLSNKSILTPSRLLSNHKSMLKPKDVKYKSMIKATAVMERHGTTAPASTATTHTKHWTGPFV